MAANDVKTPATFGDAKKKRALEANQSMAKALKEHRFEDALEHARTAMALEPNNAMVKEFVRLLEEKQQLAETDDEDEGQEAAGVTAAGMAAVDEESDEDEDDDDEDGEGETDEEEEESEEESEEQDEAVIKALSKLRMGEPADPEEAGRLKLPADERHAMRLKISKGIKELLLAELAKEMACSDPLLGA